MKMKWSVLSAFILIMTLAGHPVLADDVYWNGAEVDQYWDLTSWDPHAPQEGDNVFLNSTYSSTIIYDGSVDIPWLNLLDFDDSVSVELRGAFELNADTINIRNGANVWQYGGSVEVTDMTVGTEGSGSEYHIFGSFSLPGAEGWAPSADDVFLGVHNDLVITDGDPGQGGMFFQEGGIVFVRNDLRLTASQPLTDNRGYMLNDGVLWTKNTLLGEGSGFKFVLNDGMHFVGVDPTQQGFPLMDPGTDTAEMDHLLVGASSFYEMSGGALYAAGEIVNGGFGQGGGRHVVYRDLVLGTGQGIDAEYGLESLAELHVLGDVFVGRDGGTGTAYFWGGTFHAEGELVLGSSSAPGLDGAQGFIDQSPYYPPFVNLQDVRLPDIHVQRVVLGRDSGTSGSYMLGSGSLNAESITVGQLGSGEFVQSCGTVTFGKGGLALGESASGHGTYSLAGGDLVSHGPVHVGQEGQALFEQTGGKHTTSNILNIGGHGEYRLQGGALEAQGVVNNNVFTFLDAALTVEGEFLNQGTFQGAGEMMVGSFVNNGLLVAGSSLGTLTVAGDFVQGESGQLNIGMGADSFATLAVTGEASLGGILNITFLDGYSPAPGSTFDLLAASGLSGDFASIVGPGGWVWTASIQPGLLNGQEVEFMRFATASGTSSITSVVPLPGAALLFGSGLLGLVGLRRRELV